MNALCYKIVFSKRLGALVAVGEHAKGQGKKAGTGTRTCAAGITADNYFKNLFLSSLKTLVISVALCIATTELSQATTTGPASTALPTGYQVNNGSVAITTNAGAMTIQQTTDKASINWQSFSIGKDASVNVQQNSSSSVLLNRIVGQDPSQIFGKLNANGQVILINPNGIVFGKGGSVTASAFTASTFNLSDNDFMSGFYKYKRQGSTAGVTVEAGSSIATTGSGYVLLLGASVNNNGQITTQQGNVVLASGEEINAPSALINSINVPLSSKVRLQLLPSTVNATIQNGPEGTIHTNGGQVFMQASAIADAVASVTQSGLIDTSAPQAGAVTVLAENGKIKVDGTIKSNSTGNTNGTANRGGDIIIGRDEETGALSQTTDVSAAKLESSKGFVETSGEHLIVDGIQVKAAQWLLDPTDITITSADSGTASSGLNPSTLAPNTTGTTASTVSATTLANALGAGTSVIVKTTNVSGSGNGDITVASNIAVTGTTDATLTLQAERDIVVNSNVSIARTGDNKLNVILNSDLDGNGAGAIVMNAGSSINSNGGNITLGGGIAGTGADYARGYADATRYTGVTLNGATLTAAGGDISIRGKGNSTFTNSSNMRGVDLSGAVLTTTDSGNITINGVGGNGNISSTNAGIGLTNAAKITGSSGGTVSLTGTGGNGAYYNFGVWLSGADVKITSPGAITLTGNGGGSGAYGTNDGVMVQNSATVAATGTGSISIVGVGGNTTGNYNYGVEVFNYGSVTSQSGTINITGTNQSSGTYASGIALAPNGRITSGNSAITLTSDSLSVDSTSSINAGTSTVTIQNRTAGTLIDVGGTSADVTTGTLKLGVSSAELARVTAGTVVIGRNDGTGSGNVSVNATNMGAMGNTSGNLTVLSGNDITVNNAVTKSTGTDATLTLNAVNGVNLNAAIGATAAGVGKLNVTATANGLGATSSGLSISGSTINANGGIVNLTGTNTSSGHGITFSGVSGINASTYTVKGNSTGGNGIYFTSSTNTTSFNSTAGNSLIEGKTGTASWYGVFVYANNTVNLTTTGTAKTALTTSNTSLNGIRIGYSGGVVVNTNGDVTIGSKNNDKSTFFMQGVLNAQSGKLSVLGKSDTNNAIAIQDGGGSVTKIVGTNGAKISLDGESGSSVGVNLQSAGTVAHSVSSSGTAADGTASSIAITGVSASSSGIYTGTSTVSNTGGDVTMTGTSNGGAGMGINNGGGAISASGTLNMTGNAIANNGIYTKNALSSTAGNVVINATSTNSTALALASGASIASQGTTTLTATSSTGTSISSGGTGAIAATGGLIVDINKSGELTNVITGGTNNSGGLTKNGAGTLTLSGANTLKGISLVSAGTLALNNVNALQNSTLNTGTATGTQQVTYTVAGTNTYNLGGLQGARDLTIGANSISVGANGTNTTYSGVLSGTGGVTKVGTGNLTLSGQSTNTGDYNANAGILTLTAAAGTYRTLSGVNVNINNGAKVALPSVDQGGIISSNVIWTFGSAGGGTLDINANFVNRGANGNKFVTTGGATNTINGNINLDYATNLAGPTFNVAAGSSGTAGLIHTGYAYNGSTTQGMTKTGTGTMILTGANDYKGPISINAGTLQLGNGGTTGVLGASTDTVTINSGATLQVNRSDAITLANTITGAGNLSQAGTGSLTLTANNNYSGATTVSGGTLQIGNGGANGTLGSGAVTLSNNANLSFVRAAATTIGNDISGSGNVNATITGSSGDLILGGTTNLSSGSLNATASKSITTTSGKNITTAGGVSLAAQTGISLNGNITNNTTGSINISAGDGTTTSNAAINSVLGATVTQNAAAGITMTTDALGDLTVAKIVKGAGAGDITVASGVKLTAGTSGGNIKTISGNTITNNGTGKTLIYTGSAANSGLMANINGTLATLYLTENAGGTKNAVTRTAYGSSGGGFSGGPTTQVIFREAVDLTSTLNGVTLTKTYGDALPTNTDLVNALTNANNGAVTTKTYNAASFKASTSDVVSDLVSHGSLAATANASGLINANATGYDYTESGSAYAANGSTSGIKLVVNKKDVTLVGITAANKTYDGNNSAAITAGSVTNTAASETLMIAGSGTFSNKNADTGKAVTVSDVTTLTKSNGTGDWSNYNLTTTGPLSTTADINKKDVTVTSITAADKIYDSTNAATITAGSISTGVSNETLLISGSGTFSDKNADIGKTVTVADVTTLTKSNGTGDWSNYKLTSGSITTTATISKKSITLTGATAANKVYDQTNVATLTNSGSLTSGATTSTDNKVYSGDTVTASVTGATFGSKNVATDANGNVVSQAVTLQGLAISGTDAKNYSVSDASNVTATISKKAITLSGATAANKVYDQTNVATLTNSGSLTSGATTSSDNKVYSGDTVTASVTGATFGSKNVATDTNGNVVSQAVTLQGLAITGTDAKNYTVTDASNATATISKKSITLTGAAASDKVYDQTNVATLTNSGSLTSGATTSSDNKIYTNDSVTASVTGATFGSKNVATDANGNVVAQAVTLQGLSISGTDAKNYSVTDASNATATISKKAVTLSGATAANKVYDQTNVATLTNSGALTSGAASSTDNKVYSGDTVTASVTGATFGSKNVATDANGNVVAQAVTLQGLAISGTDAKNYSVTDASNVTATISKKAITLSGATAANKVYDQTNVATLTNSGSLTSGATTSSDNKVYSGDTVTASVTGATFGSKNVATDANGNVVAQAVTLQGLAISGTDAKNYTVTDASNATATISKKAVTLSGATAADKVYDQTNVATLTNSGSLTSGATTSSDNKIYTNDSVTASVTGATFGSKNVATDANGNVVAQAVTLQGLAISGSDAKNYTVTDASNATATISKKAITLTGAAASDKVYDQTSTATLTNSGALTSGATSASDNKVYAGDTVTASVTGATFGSKNVATDANGNVVSQAVTLQGLAISGTDAKNYTVTDASNATATISKKAVIALFTNANKPYDGNSKATVALDINNTLQQILAGDKVNVSFDSNSATYDTPTPGNKKIVKVSGVNVNGEDARNYTTASTVLTAGNVITPPIVIVPKAPTIPSNNSNASRAPVVLGTTNPFKLAATDEEVSDVCSTTNLSSCDCEASTVNGSISICYEPK